MSKTPVRNVRIPDPLWHKLGKLATKRNTSITALLIEAANLFIDTTKRPKSTPLLAGVDDEVLRRLEALEGKFEALTEQVSVNKLQVQMDVQLEVQALESEFKVLTEHVSSTKEQVHKEVQQEVQAFNVRLCKLENSKVPLNVQPEVLNTDVQKEVQAEVLNVETDTPLTQGELAQRLSLSDKAVEKARRKGSDYFSMWSHQRDPDGLTWTWEGQGGRGTPLRYVPVKP
jgi:hypothetical protein